jgi:predicted nucleic acid-binding protein
LTYPADENHKRALAVEAELNRTGRTIVTIEEVFIEYLAFFSDKGCFWRRRAVAVVEGLRCRRGVDVCPQTSASFQRGLDLYAARPDKAYSLTDCIAMQVMRRDKLTEVLTNDRHFEQEGLRAV